MSEDTRSDRSENRSAIRRSTWTFALIAIAFYVGFIMIGVLRS